MHRRLEPKLLTVFREGYTRGLFFSDLTAGLTVGVVALPLAIAFAIASGVKPEQGLYTAIVGGFVIATLESLLAAVVADGIAGTAAPGRDDGGTGGGRGEAKHISLGGALERAAITALLRAGVSRIR